MSSFTLLAVNQLSPSSLICYSTIPVHIFLEMTVERTRRRASVTHFSPKASTWPWFGPSGSYIMGRMGTLSTLMLSIPRVSSPRGWRGINPYNQLIFSNNSQILPPIRWWKGNPVAPRRCILDVSLLSCPGAYKIEQSRRSGADDIMFVLLCIRHGIAICAVFIDSISSRWDNSVLRNERYRDHISKTCVDICALSFHTIISQHTLQSTSKWFVSRRYRTRPKRNSVDDSTQSRREYFGIKAILNDVLWALRVMLLIIPEF